MLGQIVSLAIETLRAPRDSAERVLAFQIDRAYLWMAVGLVAVVSVLASRATLLFVPDELQGTGGPLPTSPFLLALVIWGLLTVSVFCTHYIGRAFDGKGDMEGALLTTVWLQIVLLVLQVVQIVLFLLSPIIALLFGYLGAMYVFYIFLNFVLVLHRFQSLGMVLAGTLVSMIGVLFGLSLLIGVIAGLFGLEIATNV